GVARREEIISAAIEEFSRHGFRGRGIKQLAARLGRREAGLFHHFGTKADLLLAVLRERHSHGAKFFECVSSRRGRASL
ncbi:helix-turn-helix domain-containing protein, partial [Acinetobacter baumannii]